MAVITGTSQMQTLDIFLENIEKTFGDPDWAWMACTQLHELKMTPGTMAGDYMAWFEMFTGRTGLNDAVLEDIYIQGLPSLILQKIFAQVTLPNGLAAWKMVVRNLNCLHQSLTELKWSTGQMNPFVGCTSQTVGQAKHRLPPPPVRLHTSWLAHRHWILPLLWMSTYRRHSLKLRSATTLRKLDTLQTTAQSLVSSMPETNFWRTSQNLRYYCQSHGHSPW